MRAVHRLASACLAALLAGCGGGGGGKAALRPIGVVGLPTGTSAYGGVAPLGSGFATPGEPMGDAVARALAQETIAVFDSLWADFRTSALALLGGAARPSLADRLRDVSRGEDVASGEAANEAGEEAAFGFHVGAAGAVGARLGLVASNAGLASGPGTLAALAPDGRALGVRVARGGGRALTAFGVASATQAGEGASTGLAAVARSEARPFAAGGGLAYSWTLGSAEATLGASVLAESGSTLGLTAAGPGASLSGRSGALHVAARLPLGERSRLALSAEVGVAQARGTVLIEGTRGVGFSAFGLAFETEWVFAEGDSVSVFFRQPIRVETESADLVAPSGRTLAGDALRRAIEGGLAPAARQVDVGVEYATPLGPGGRLKLGAAYSHDEGHVAGAAGWTAMGSYQRAF